MTISLPDIQAVILAGGLGTRLRSVVADKPKCLAEINGRPFLAYLLDQLAAAGIRKVTICTGFLSEQVQDAFKDIYNALAISYSPEAVPLGTGGALRNALPLLETSPLLVMNGDSYLTADLRAYAAFHQTKGAKISMLLTEVPDAGRYGRVETDNIGRVVRFLEKGDEGRGWINAGIYLFQREVIAAIPEGREVSLEREVLPKLVGGSIFARRTTGHFIDIGTPESYRETSLFFETVTREQRKSA